ncbi:MAG: DUF899 family protein [Solirubrobacterales bacterium]|nr:DUF899 family protein [Solirubrobacterales bacterium]
MKLGTEQEWQAAHKELLAGERELEKHAEQVEKQRRELPWVPVEEEYGFATENGHKSLVELFEGRSQLLIYHLMFGEAWRVACPGCSSLVDGLSDGILRHLNNRDVTLTCMSQAPLENVVAEKERQVGRCRGYPPARASSCSTTASRSAGRRCRASFVRSSTWASSSARRRSGCATIARRSGRRTLSRRFP